MEKSAFLCSFEARWFLRNACYNSGDVAAGVKHFIIGAKQGDKNDEIVVEGLQRP